MNKKVLYISYDGALDPLGYSQITPYLLGLSKKGVKFTLLTYEKKERLNDIDRVNKLKKILENANIKWVILRYHKSPTMPTTTFDMIIGIIKGFIIVLSDKIQLIHARSFVGAIPAIFLKKVFNLKFIFDMRGFWADERVEGNIWSHRGLLYKIAKWWEKLFLINADWIVCLTEEAKSIIQESSYFKGKRISIDVIPTCVNTAKFEVKKRDRDLLKKLNLQDRFVFLYFGSLGTWYMFREMIDFFKIAKQINPNSFFLILTPDKYLANAIMLEKGVKENDFLIDFVHYPDIPNRISIADAAIFFIKPTYSKKSSCPTKCGESLACGLPLAINAGIGDIDKIVKANNIGVVIDNFLSEEYEKAANQLFEMLKKEGDSLVNRCRKVSEDIFSLKNAIERYYRIYCVLGNSN